MSDATRQAIEQRDREIIAQNDAAIDVLIETLQGIKKNPSGIMRVIGLHQIIDHLQRKPQASPKLPDLPPRWDA